ncbi:hypothetical protein ACH5RR_012640 [Cinchona calisaya]|uniref:Uncharacterized protein n=1 Tax=Cinchona calisaya TaxID=153742 RepID=A0ABD3A8C2_9GENT
MGLNQCVACSFGCGNIIECFSLLIKDDIIKETVQRDFLNLEKDLLSWLMSMVIRLERIIRSIGQWVIWRKLEKELLGGRTHFVDTCYLPISTSFSALKLL